MLSAFRSWYDRLFVTLPWDRTFGIGRSLVALGSLLTLVFTPTSVLFLPTAEWDPGRCTGMTGRISLFCLGLPLELMHWVSAAVLVVVVAGWRPRWAAIPHAWVAISLQASLSVVEGGDQIAGNVALLMIPICLTDSRVWHWSVTDASKISQPSIPRMFGNFGRALVALQASVIYLNAAVAKLSQDAWLDGTVVYYWINDPTFGSAGLRKAVMDPVVENAVLVSLMTWGSIVIELLLAAALVAGARYRRGVLPLGIALHAGIALFLGLTHFSMIMAGVLVLYLLRSQPPNSEEPNGEVGTPEDGVGHAIGQGARGRDIRQWGKAS